MLYKELTGINDDSSVIFNKMTFPPCTSFITIHLKVPMCKDEQITNQNEYQN